MRATRHSQSRSTFLVVVQGVARVKVSKLRSDAKREFYVADVEPMPRETSLDPGDAEGKAMINALRTLAADMIEALDPNVSSMASSKINLTTMSPSLLADLLASHTGVDIAAAQNILETTPMGPSREKSASRSLRRALLTPQVNPGSLYRCAKRT